MAMHAMEREKKGMMFFHQRSRGGCKGLNPHVISVILKIIVFGDGSQPFYLIFVHNHLITTIEWLVGTSCNNEIHTYMG